MADDPANKPKEQAKLIKQQGRKGSDDSPRELASLSQSKKLEEVLLHTQRLIEHDLRSDPCYRLKREGKKSWQDTVIMGGAGLELHVIEWKITGDETHLVLRDAYFLQDHISILSPLCQTVKHISIDLHWMQLHPLTLMPKPLPMPMKSVITVCLKSVRLHETLYEVLFEVSNLFPNAESLDMQIGSLSSPSDQAYSHEVHSSSSLRELKLRFEGRYDITTDSLLMDISTSCPNIVSLVLSGFGRCVSNKSGKEITSFKMPHLTNIHLEPFGTDDRYRFETLMNVLHVVHVTSPRLRFVEAEKVQLGDAELTFVKWSQTSSGYELQLEGASAAVPMSDLMHLVSNELEGATVLTFDRCEVDFHQSIGHPPQSTGEERPLRELKFLNVECPLFQTDIHKLSEMYPNLKVTVEYESQASHEDSEQGTVIPFTPERKTFPSSTPSPTSPIEQLQGASSSKTLQAPHRSKGGIMDKISAKQEDFDEKLKAVAKSIVEHEQMDNLGKVLIFERVHILRYIYTHMKNAEAGRGTLSMFRDWRNKQTKATACEALKDVLEKAGQIHLADELFDELVGATSRVQVHEEQTDTQNTEEEENDEEEEDCVTMESLSHETVSAKPIKMECCKRVGVEGGTLQLDSFGIELEIPPGAIDSEVPQDIYLRVLTDTPNLGNNKEEMSVCFGVQCLAPGDLVLKLPVTYTIPHCAVITRYSSVEAVLYTGEGEYSPNAKVKEQIPLTQSGIPNCKIKRDTLRLQMNHFSWAFIRFKLTVFFGGKRMRCLPFAEKPLPEEKNTVVLRAHLYDDIKGIYMKIASQEEGVGFACIHPEAEVLISVAEVDVKMTCFIKRDPIGDTIHTVKYDELCRGHHRTRSFNLDLRSQPDEKIVVTLQIGQTGQSVEELLCIFKFTTPRTSTSLPTRGQEQLQGASSSQTLQASYRSTGETLRNISGRQEDFDDKLTTVAQKVSRRDEIDNLGKALGFEPEDIQRYVDTNMKNTDVSYMGTLSMLRYWRKKQTEATECKALKGVLEKAGQNYLADKLFGTSRDSKHILLN